MARIIIGLPEDRDDFAGQRSRRLLDVETRRALLNVSSQLAEPRVRNSMESIMEGTKIIIQGRFDRVCHFRDVDRDSQSRTYNYYDD